MITRIYFEQGPLRDLLDIDGADGVSFAEGGSPKSLPGGNALWPQFDTAFRLWAKRPSPHNGANNGLPVIGELVSALFDLEQRTAYVLQALRTGTLRVGLREWRERVVHQQSGHDHDRHAGPGDAHIHVVGRRQAFFNCSGVALPRHRRSR